MVCHHTFHFLFFFHSLVPTSTAHEFAFLLSALSSASRFTRRSTQSSLLRDLSAMSGYHPPGCTYRAYIDGLLPDQRKRLAYNLPGNRFVDSDLKLRMCHCSEQTSTALAGLHRMYEPPRDPNTLPRDLWDKPSLIDFDHWVNVNEKLRKQGMRGNVNKGARVN